MSIPISDLVQVDIAISPNAIATDGFGPLLFLSKEFVPTVDVYPVRSYTSLKEVLADFPGGEIAKAATTWYSQKPTPKTFLVGAIKYDTLTPATPATVTAATAAVLATIKLETAATLQLSVSGVQYVTGPIDFSSAEDFAGVANLVTTALSSVGAGVTVTQEAGKFKLTTSATGINATISDVGGKVGEVLKLQSSNSAVIVAGKNELSISSDLSNIADAPFNFFYVGLDRQYRGKSSPVDNQMSVAKWCEASSKVFGWGDNDKNILINGTDNSFRRAKNQNLRNTLCVYDASANGDEYPEISILGRASTVNFNVANSVLILAYKKGPGISTADLSSGQVSALISCGGNAFISVAGNVMFYNGRMADGTWFDSVQGVEWLTQKVRLNVFNLFYTSTTKIPWTDTGVAMVNQQVTLALELAKTNGLIAPGYDNEGVFYPEGYKVISTPLELLQSQKGERIWEGTSFIAIGSGAIQGAVISGNFIQ